MIISNDTATEYRKNDLDQFTRIGSKIMAEQILKIWCTIFLTGNYDFSFYAITKNLTNRIK